jgi:osmotically-inducible protein OsmY
VSDAVSDAFYLQRVSITRLSERQPICGYRGRFALMIATFLGATGACLGQEAAETANARLQEVTIQAKRQAADEQVTLQVEKALSKDPWIYSEHVTVTTRDGVVTVEGIVQDTVEWFRILRLAGQIPGARRVVDRLEMLHNDPDGG